MVKQVEDGKINTLERLQNIWMKVTRGDVATRFDKIKRVYLDVAQDSRDQVEREHIIANAYQDFRGAVKEIGSPGTGGLEEGRGKAQRRERGARSGQ